MRVLVSLLLLFATVARADPYDFKTPTGIVVPGAPLEEITSLATQVERVRAATKLALGVEIGRVPVHVVTIEELRLLHEEVGGKLPHGFSLFGFELEGHVFVRHALGGIPDEVLIHECLHAMSERFSQQIHRAGVGKVVEGITQYFTLEALAARPDTAKLKRDRNQTYVAFTELADAIATLVGEEALKRAYFDGGVQALATSVDKAAHGKNLLMRSAHALEDGDPRKALALIGGD